MRTGCEQANLELKEVRGRLDPLHATQEQRCSRVHQRKRHHQISQCRGQQVHQLLQVSQAQRFCAYSNKN